MAKFGFKSRSADYKNHILNQFTQCQFEDKDMNRGEYFLLDLRAYIYIAAALLVSLFPHHPHPHLPLCYLKPPWIFKLKAKIHTMTYRARVGSCHLSSLASDPFPPVTLRSYKHKL